MRRVAFRGPVIGRSTSESRTRRQVGLTATRPMEFVYVVRRRDLFEPDSPQGFRSVGPAGSPSAATLVSASAGAASGEFLEAARTKGFFVERRHAERDSSLKQIIPYCVMVDADALDVESLEHGP